jgi:hypothetical protein
MFVKHQLSQIKYSSKRVDRLSTHVQDHGVANDDKKEMHHAPAEPKHCCQEFSGIIPYHQCRNSITMLL